MSPGTQKITKNILDFAYKYRISFGKPPKSMAAASIYIASFINNENRTQKEISAICKITETTIRNRFKEISKHPNFSSIFSKKEGNIY